MAKMILHVGTHKTGTTSLQRFLSENRAALKAQGMCYFDPPEKYATAIVERNGHFLLRHAKDTLKADQATKRALRATKHNILAFKKAVGECDTIVLSDEALFYQQAIRPDTMPLIQELLRDCGITDVRIIVYLRRQDEFATSLWKQRVKNSMKLTASIHEYVKSPRVVQALDYQRILSEFAELFGKDNVCVRVYKRDMLENRDIRYDFCAQVGIDVGEGFVYSDDSNASLSNNYAEILRQANHAPAYQDADTFLHGPAERLSVIGDASSMPLLTPEERTGLLEQYAEGNAWVAREFLGREDGVLFEGSDHFPAAWQSDLTPLEQDIIRLFAEVLAEEHEARVRDEKRLKVLEKQVSKLSDCDAKINTLTHRVDGLNASLGPIARLRRKLWRKRMGDEK